MDESQVMSLLTIKGMADKASEKQKKRIQKQQTVEKKKKEVIFMGPRYKPISLQSVCEKTQFTKREVQLMYRGFKQECPTGIVNEETFSGVFSQFFPQGKGNITDAAPYANLVFRNLDRNKNGCITFEEFMYTLSTLVYGSNEEKIRWAFELYDQDGDGKISHSELTEVIKAVYAMLGENTDPPVNEDIVEQHIITIARQLGPAEITYDRFFTWCHRNQQQDTSFREFWTDLRLRN